MAGDPLRKVRPGDDLEFPADTFNTFIDTAKWKKAQERSQSRNAKPKSTPNPAVVLARNSSGVDRFIGDALGLGDAIFTPDDNLAGFKGRVAVSGAALDPALHFGKAAVLLEPIAADGIGRAAVAGVVAAKINVTDENHQYAAPTDENDQVLSSTSGRGYRILYKQSGIGIVWAYLWLDIAGTLTLIGKTASTITAISGDRPGSGAMDVYQLGNSGALESAGFSLTIHNLGDEVESGVWCQAKLEPFSGEFFGDWAYCGE